MHENSMAERRRCVCVFFLTMGSSVRANKLDKRMGLGGEGRGDTIALTTHACFIRSTLNLDVYPKLFLLYPISLSLSLKMALNSMAATTNSKDQYAPTLSQRDNDRGSSSSSSLRNNNSCSSNNNNE